MKPFPKLKSMLIVGVLAVGATACGNHLGVANASGAEVGNQAQPKASPAPSNPIDASNGYAFCQSAMQQLPTIIQDNQAEGKDTLGFIQFTAGGKIELAKNASVQYVEQNADGDVAHIGLNVLGDSQQISFDYQDGKVKDVTIQRFQDGAWIRDKAIFLLSSDENQCYVQHLNTDVEVYPHAPVTTVSFDLETCRLAQDVSLSAGEQEAVLANGGITAADCQTDFAKAASQRFYGKSLSGPGATYHQAPLPAPAPAAAQGSAAPQAPAAAPASSHAPTSSASASS